MTNEKKYFEFLDIPDGIGGTERWHAKDAEAQEEINQCLKQVTTTQFNAIFD